MSRFVDELTKAVARFHDKIAITDQNGERSTTYKQLDVISDQIAKYLQEHGCVHGDCIIIDGVRRMEYIAAELAAFKIGCAYIPASPEYPKERKDMIQEESHARILLTDEMLDEAAGTEIKENEILQDALREDDIALIIYTSGSTGRPKGVAHTAASVYAGCGRNREAIGFDENTRYLHTSPFTFVAAPAFIFSCLLSGAEIVIMPESQVRDLRRIESYIEEKEISHIFLSPQFLLDFQNQSKSLKTVVTGSDKVSGVCGNGYRLVNLYGMSETFVTVLYFEIDKRYDATPIGKPVSDDYCVYLLDENGNEVTGEGEGEICIAGCISSGYYNNEEETKKVFVKNPFDDGHPILFHTHDVARRLSDGNLVYVNRKDWMVKINGQRVETGEIEALLKEIDGVENAVVKAFDNEYGISYLCAYYKSERDMDSSEFTGMLSKNLPAYMIPAFFVKLEEFPLNANGKLDRKALEAPDASLYRVEYEKPHSDAEKTLCEVFENILQCGQVGINDNFFSLGGNSINVLRLIEESGLSGLTPDVVLLAKTPKKIAAALMEKKEDFYADCHEERDYYPLTDSQMGVYLECCENPESTMYNIPSIYRAEAGLDPEKLAKAIQAAIELHPLMKICIENIDGTPVMKQTERSDNVEIVRLTEREVRAYAKAFVRPFDLEQDSLFRMKVMVTESHVYFILDVHHLIFDGTSMSVFVDDIRQLYEGKVPEGEELTLFDLAVAEEKIIQTDAYKQGIEFFGQKLDGMEVDSNLIPDADFAESKDSEPGGIATGTLFSEGSREQLEDFLRKSSVTESSLFMSAFAYTLAKFTGQSEAAFCTVNNGRHDVRLKKTVGMLVRTLPLHIVLHDAETASAYVANVHNEVMEAMAHDLCRFSDLSEKFGVTSDIMFVYQADLLEDVVMDKVVLKASHLPVEPQANLVVMIFKNKGSYEIRLEYRKSLYSEKLMNIFIDSMNYVLHQIIANKTLEQIELITDEQKHMIDLFNHTSCPYDHSKTIVDLFREQVKRVPDHTAVIYKDVTLTYSQLDDMTDRIAQYLHTQGIGTEDVVSILIGRSENMPVCALGTLKSGAAYQPLDPSYPMERLKFMMEDASAKLLIADEELMNLVPDYQGRVLLTKDIQTLQNTGMQLAGPKPEDLFIMLYTSGSTGVPKGCMLEHKNIAAFVHWYHRYYELDDHCVVGAYASFGFDADMMDLYPALTAGAAVVIIGEDIRLDLTELNQYYEKTGITHAFMTTQIGRQFALLEGHENLRHLSVGGEKLVPVTPVGTTAFYNVYGPTETTIFTTAFPVNRKYDDVPIGKSLDNLKLYVVDSHGQLLPPGAPGELWISGIQVSRGYLNRPEQNEKAYSINPFSKEADYERVYHSGDIVRYLTNGEIQFVGRRDGQVKVRGFRIELTEVEEVIREYPGIKDATVAAFDEPSGGKYVAAYIVSDEKINIEELERFILDRKPPYMVPAVTMQIDQIPLNQNQKVNKRALPVPVRKIENSVPPENEMQQQILDVIAEVIGHKEFGITTDIYRAGLTSIGAVKLNVMLAKVFGASVKIKDLKENPTVKQLEAFLKEQKTEETYAYQADYPLTQTQQGIFVECMAHPDTVMYNIPALICMDDTIDTGKLAAAIKAAVDAHPYLKTRLFMNDDGDIRLRRLDQDETFEVEFLNIKHVDEIKQELIKPFNLLGGRLLRAKIIEAEQNYLFLEVHHIISDGTSLAIFLDDISAAYAGEALEKESYSGFERSVDEEQARKTEVYTSAKNYYEGIFAGCDAECLPMKDVSETKEPCSRTITDFGKRVSAEAVKAYCDANGLTMNAFFTTAFGVLVSKLCRKDDAVFATIYNGRDDSRLYRTVTMLVKTFPVMCHAGDGEQKIQELIAGMGTQLMDSMSNDLYSFAEISRAFSITADVMFAYQGDEFTFDKLCGKDAKLIELNLDQAKAPFNVNVYIENNQMKYVFEYRADMYSSELMNGFIDAYESVVSEFLTKEKIKEISILSDTSWKRMRAFNDTEAELENTVPCVLFERQAAAHPDKKAVIAAGRSLTFAELNKKANQVAHTLIEHGIAGDEIAALMLHRTVDVYAVREGILKSGGAFLSVEPDYPDDRISYIIENSGAKLFVTTRALYEERKPLLDSLSCEILFLEDIASCTKTENPGVSIRPESLAYCIYTSGSTGKPKGVMIEQRNLINMLNYCEKNILAKDYVDHTTVFLGLAAITFDVSIIEEMMPMYHGQTVAMATDEEIHNPILLAKMMLENGVDMMKCTPSYMMTIMDMEEVQKALCKLKAIIIGAEAFPKGLYQKMREIGMTAKIFNSYGPTETTVTVTIDELDGKNITIGRTANNVKVFMLDKFGNILPENVPGELTIIGKSVGRGYVGLEEATKEKFIEFQGEPAYRSGDIAYWNKDGKIQFCGRADNQVKLRGLRVELDEIENAINTYPTTKRSVVLVRDNQYGQYLCAYFTATEKVDTTDLTAHLAKTLTNYMIPGVFVQLDSMPMNNNGKVDKKALPEPQMTITRTAGKAPQTELEKKLCEIFKEAIGIDQIGVDDDFFEMGGTSLSASKVAMKCMMGQIPIVYANVFEYKTVERLVAFIQSQQSEQGDSKETVSTASTDVSKEQPHTPFDEEYAKAESVLVKNTIDYIDEVHPVDIGNVLLTGATGFLGIHVLKKLLDSDTKKIYCLVRAGKIGSPAKHLKMLLMYYFNDTFDEELQNRISIIQGDITDANLKEGLEDCEFDTVINCAACVKHFVNDDLLERVNVRGVQNLITVCKDLNKRLVQVSTVSVAGMGTAGSVPYDKKIKENDLYFGQNLDNQYVNTKFRAEKYILEAVAEGMKGKIVRVGNLMSRYEDGEFQVNYHTNGFMNRLRAYAAVGEYPVNSMDARAEFSPIDKVAESIITLAGTPDIFTVFHAYNCHTVHMANVLDALGKCGIDVKPVENDEFQKTFAEKMSDESTSMMVSALISYMSNDKTVFPVSRENEFTTKALYRLGFSWPLIDELYLQKAIMALVTLGFFDKEK